MGMKSAWCCCCGSQPTKNEKSELKQDLTTEDTHQFRHPTIEELKSKLGEKDIIEEGESRAAMIPEHPHKPPSPPAVTEHGLIMPRKPPNPVKENTERQTLHKELLFNQRIGKNVLNQKTELQRVLARQKDHIAKKEQEINTSGNTPELEKVIADRAKRLQNNHEKNEDDKVINKEFLEARMKLKARTEAK